MIVINNDILLFVSLVVCISAAIRAVYLQRKNSRLAKDLKSALSSLSSIHNEIETLRQNQPKVTSFETDLNEAEVTTKLQKSRIDMHEKNYLIHTPERYRYIHSLREKGMSSEDIATILSISRQEAEQLVTLANLARKQSPAPAKE